MRPGDLIRVDPRTRLTCVGLCPIMDAWIEYPASTFVSAAAPVLVLGVVGWWVLILNDDGRCGWAETDRWVQA